MGLAIIVIAILTILSIIVTCFIDLWYWRAIVISVLCIIIHQFCYTAIIKAKVEEFTYGRR